MMVKKLAGFFATLGVIVYFASWLYRYMSSANGSGPMGAEKAWEIGIYIATIFWILGMFVSTLGIGLMQEVLAERRSRDIERKFRAKAAYDLVINSGSDGLPNRGESQ